MSSATATSTPEKPRANKRLVVCCDGTWQSSVTIKKNVPSNVTRLARSIAREDVVKDKDGNETVWEQIVYYDAGIGTGEISKSEKDRQGGFGHGFVANVIEAYNFLVLNYREGDKIYCFGFSRGAYTARAVAGLVNDIGIISPRDMQDFPELYTAYSAHKGNDSHTFRKSREYRKWQTGILSMADKDKDTGLILYDQIPHALVKETSRLVEVCGVFDTVGSLGVPESPYFTVDALMTAMNYWWGGEKPGFHNVNLSPYISNAFHAIALDEHRSPFSPTLWHLPPPPPGLDVDTGVKEVYTEKEVEKWQARKEALAELHKTSRATFESLHFGKKKALKKKKEEAAATSSKRSAKEQAAQDAADEEEYEKQVDEAWEKLIDAEMEELCHGLHQSNMVQTWFPGVHINIGGGSDDPLVDRDADFEQIALITFAWMCEQVAPFLRFEERLRKRAVRDRMALIIPVKAEIAAGGNKDYGSWGKSLWKALDYTGLKKATSKQIAPDTVCGWATGPIIDSYTGSVKATGSKIRTPGGYNYDYSQKGSPKLLGETMESIHPSIAYRMKAVKDYNPPALKGFKRSWNDTLKQWEWKKEGTEIMVPEFQIPKDAKFSRFLTYDYTIFLAQEEQREIQEKKKDIKITEKSVAPPTVATEFLEATDVGQDWVTK